MSRKLILAVMGATAMAAAAVPAAAAPFYTSKDKTSFDASRNVTSYGITGSSGFALNYSQNGVTFSNLDQYLFNDNGFGAGTKYLGANQNDSVGLGTPLTVTFSGTVLGLTLGSYYGAQTVGYIANGVSGSIDLAAGRATSFIGFDTGGPSGISVTFFPGKELDVLGFQTAVPEAATWVMTMVGMGLVGGSLRRRGKVRARFAAA